MYSKSDIEFYKLTPALYNAFNKYLPLLAYVLALSPALEFEDLLVPGAAVRALFHPF